MTTKAPVGPPIWKRLPPRAEIRKPATTAVTRPASGVAPEAMASAMARGRATTATVRPAMVSARKSPKPYPCLRTVTVLGRNSFQSEPFTARRLSFDQPDSASGPLTGAAVGDHLHPGLGHRGDDLLEAVDDGANRAGAGLHALDRLGRQSGQARQFALVDAEERPGGAELGSGDHSELHDDRSYITKGVRKLKCDKSPCRGGGSMRPTKKAPAIARRGRIAVRTVGLTRCGRGPPARGIVRRPARRRRLHTRRRCSAPWRRRGTGPERGG